MTGPVFVAPVVVEDPMPVPPESAPTVDCTDLADTIAGLRKATSERDRWAETAKALRAVLEHRLGEREIGLVDGRETVRHTYVTTRRLDTKKLRENHAQLAEDFTVEVHSRRFGLVEVQE